MIRKPDSFPIQDDPENDSKGTIGGVGILRLNALTEVQIGEFLRGSRAIGFEGQSRAEIYAVVQESLVRQEYFRQSKKQRGAIRAYLSRLTGRSLPQMTRLIRQQKANGEIRAAERTRRRFATRYTDTDVGLLAEVDRAHERLNGPSTRRILQREYGEFGGKEYERLAGIPASHIYNLRKSPAYRSRTVGFGYTKPTGVSIAERRRPDAKGRPGYIRIDTVHQGDWEGVKGVYHINAVDTVTQWEIAGCVEKISERYLIPVLEAILHQFPFRIISFHSDNGSEFINRRVAEMLEGLLIEFTKSRPAAARTTLWWKARTERSFANSLGMGISRRRMPKRCRSSTRRTSILI
jgi:hypothetical protein